MPKDSCVIHPKGYYLEFRRDYVELFHGDHCAAVLCGLLEYLTNGEMARLRVAEENGEPWIKASMPSILEDTLALYSVRSLQSRIDWLESVGIVRVDRQVSGKIRRYLFDCDLVSEMLRLRRVLDPPGSIGKIADEKNGPPSAKPSAEPSAETTKEGGALNLKEESPITDNKTLSVGSPPETSSEEKLTPELVRRKIEEILKVRLSRQQRDLVLGGEYWSTEQRVVEELSDLRDSGIENPLAAFLKIYSVGAQTQRKRPEGGLPPRYHRQHLPPRPAAPQQQWNAPQESALLGEFVGPWNGKPSLPTVCVLPLDRRDMVAFNAAIGEGAFRDNYPAILDKCSDLCEKGGQKAAAFMNFGYMCQNWRKIMNGGCNWMLSGDFGATSKPTEPDIFEVAKQKRREARNATN